MRVTLKEKTLKEKTASRSKRRKDYEGDREWGRDRERVIRIKCPHANRNDAEWEKFEEMNVAIEGHFYLLYMQATYFTSIVSSNAQ